MGCAESKSENQLSAAPLMESMRKSARNLLPQKVDKSRASGPKPTDSVCIVGAGSAGIHMAAQLQRLGIKKVTILEASDRLGGKSESVEHNGIMHELGTCYMHADYTEIRDLMSEYGMDGSDIDIGGRVIRTVMGGEELDRTKGMPHLQWLLSQTETPAVMMDVLQNFSEEKMHETNLWKAIKQYGVIHRSLGMFGTPHSLPLKPSDMEKINMTFREFLESHKLQILLPLFRYAQEAQGYGLVDEIPALYGLWWNTPHFIEHAFHWHRDPPTMAMFKSGFQKLWEKIAVDENLNIFKNANVTNITRHHSGRNPIQVSYQQGEHVKKIHCDFLVMAVDMSSQHHLISDLGSEERLIFTSMIASTLATTLYECDVPADGVPRTPEEFWTERIKLNDAVYGVRESAVALKTVEKGPKGRVSKVAYQYNTGPPEGSEEKLQQRVLSDLEEMGEKNVKIIETTRSWRYMPRFDQDGINHGHPWRIRGLQGKDRTWYIGSSVCFESVIDVVRYNLGLLEQLRVSEYKA